MPLAVVEDQSGSDPELNSSNRILSHLWKVLNVSWNSIGNSSETSRRGPWSQGRWVVVWLSLLVVVSLVHGCNSPEAEEPSAQVDLKLSPSPPVVGEAEVDLKVSDAEGQPLKGADIRLEGNMNHAGMKPSFADLTEKEPGHYTGTLNFTMGGDWFVLVTAKTAEGKTVKRKIDVPGVKSK